MIKNKIYLANNEIITDNSEISGQFVELDGEKYYQIKNYHEMPDFFISIVSDSDHWMFISSNGSLSAGRKDRDNALFPYYTVDKIHDYRGITGSKSIFLIEKNNKKLIWEPFTKESARYYKISRNIYKNIYGNKLIFEEINYDLEICFSYSWNSSEKFGFIKTSKITNLANTETSIEIADGLLNISPYGVGYFFQNEYSNLLDAYKKNELVKDSTIGLFMLSSIPVDKAEPSESLRTTSVWSYGFGKKCKLLLSDNQLNDFRKGFEIETETDIRASRGAYFINASIQLKPEEIKNWITIAEINQGSTDIANLQHFIETSDNVVEQVRNDIEKGTRKLKQMVSSSDGLQLSATTMCYARHYTNTMFNIMRGGIFANNYNIEKSDLVNYIWQINKLVSQEHKQWITQLPDNIEYNKLITIAEKTNNSDLIRIIYEYLPLTFSRRHGDPSRPWNQFSIETKNEDGSLKYNYQGNWRDIFQNWEALCFSYPEFAEGIIYKFVNATTIDGYNPYRIMRDGIDWESPDPDDPWAYIGYWGDHQIIYLQKLLELSENFHPGKINEFLSQDIFTYANVPYRIKSYQHLVKDPKNTVDFDFELDKIIKNEAIHLGADAAMIKNKSDNQIYKVNFTEKILATLLSKLSNFIPEAGIWLNTQRPEWNDANNALVGNGASMVTLYYLRRFIKFWNTKFQSISITNFSVSVEMASLFNNMNDIFKENISFLEKGFNDKSRKDFSDKLGEAHSKYREEVYNFSFSGEKLNINKEQLASFTKIALRYIDQSIAANKRPDGLYHSYNLVSFKNDRISIRNLYEMLEGQVAVLSSGFLSPKENLNVLNSLKNSKIYRPDQFSYMLYPDRQLARFTVKNVIPSDRVKNSKLLSKFIKDKETSIIKIDKYGNYHFNGAFRNSEGLKKALNELRFGVYSHLIEEENENILSIYEEIFDHQSFTGRSGTFYGYEGLGSIYWHMVSKLLLATNECFYDAIDKNEEEYIVNSLKEHYYEIKAGIGIYKSPKLYGAFPTDAYSHTPADSGVKQPGLTGQVKEDVISRIGELGVRIYNGKIRFNKKLLNESEILKTKQKFSYYSIQGKEEIIQLAENQIAFTFCQTPVIYSFSQDESITVTYKNGNSESFIGNELNYNISKMLYQRTGDVEKIEVTLSI